jgi:hypothetical protein
MIKNRTWLVLAFIVFVTVVCLGCSSVPSAEIEEFLAKQGFDAEVSHPSVSVWESQTFNLAKKEQWEAKSRAEVPNWSGAYYRFTIVKESYQSQQDATARLSRLREKPPGLTPEDDKAFPLREGFNMGNEVYIVSCRVSMFHEHLKEFTRELEQEVKRGRRVSVNRNPTSGWSGLAISRRVC